MSWCQNIKLIGQLIRADLIPFNQFFVGKLINACVWVSIAVLVVGYIFPHMGIPQSFVKLYVTGTMVSFGIFEINQIVSVFVADVAGDRSITYPLLLPIKSSFWYLYLVLSHALRTGCFTVVLFPLIKLLLGDRLPLDQMSWVKFFVMFFSISLFIAVMALFLVSIVRTILKVSDIWFRYLFPLWFFGGSQYSWKTLYQIDVRLAYASLLNPFLYAYEGIHAAFFGSIDYLPFGVCITMLWLFIIVFGFWGFFRLKRWLDFV